MGILEEWRRMDQFKVYSNGVTKRYPSFFNFSLDILYRVCYYNIRKEEAEMKKHHKRKKKSDGFDILVKVIILAAAILDLINKTIDLLNLVD